MGDLHNSGCRCVPCQDAVLADLERRALAGEDIGGYVPPLSAPRPGEVIDPTKAGRELRREREDQFVRE